MKPDWQEVIYPWMKLRLDLLEQMTPADIAEQAEKNVHRFKPEPRFSKTGAGSLSPASTSERAQEVEHSMELTRKLEQRVRNAGKKSGTKS